MRPLQMLRKAQQPVSKFSPPRYGHDPKVVTEELKASGMNAYYYVSPETAHEWQTWRRSLYQFAQLLFK